MAAVSFYILRAFGLWLRLAVVALLLIAFSPAARAQFTSTSDGNGGLIITGYSGLPPTHLLIPSTLNNQSVTGIGPNAFASTGVVNVTISNGITSIGNYAFFSNPTLTSVSIPSSVTSIGVAAFSITGLTSVTIPSSVTTISGDAFNGTDLTTVTIPNGVTTIGAMAFTDCSRLISVSIPASVSSIGSDAFSGCSELSSITVSGENAVYSSVNGVLFSMFPNFLNTPVPTLVQYPAGLYGSYTIPNGVTTIGIDAFVGCAGLTSIVIPSSVTEITSGAFDYCTNLTSAVFIGNAPTMGTTVFSNTASGFTVYYNNGATGFTSPTWTDNSGDTYPAQIIKLPQSITFPAIANHQYPASSFALNATASSGLLVTYSLVSGPASLSGTNNNTVTVTGTGSVTIQASQAGNGTYAAATSMDQSFTALAPVAFTGNPTATPENDGVANLLKYVFDINPSSPMSAADYAALPALGETTNGGNECITLTYHQYALATGITVNVQTSTDLQSWRTVNPPDLTQQVGTDSTTGDPIMEVGVKTNGLSTQFIRLNVTMP